MKTQQQVLRDALTLVLGTTPVKGQLSITPEQRELVADEMMKTYDVEWTIKSEVAKSDPRRYIVGEKSTDLIQSWTFKHLTSAEKKAKAEAKSGAVVGVSEAPAVGMSKLQEIKVALESGLISKEQASELTLALLAA